MVSLNMSTGHQTVHHTNKHVGNITTRSLSDLAQDPPQETTNFENSAQKTIISGAAQK
jgi:hypothetical protein